MSARRETAADKRRRGCCIVLKDNKPRAGISSRRIWLAGASLLCLLAVAGAVPIDRVQAQTFGGNGGAGEDLVPGGAGGAYGVAGADAEDGKSGGGGGGVGAAGGTGLLSGGAAGADGGGDGGAGTSLPYGYGGSGGGGGGGGTFLTTGTDQQVTTAATGGQGGRGGSSRLNVENNGSADINGSGGGGGAGGFGIVTTAPLTLDVSANVTGGAGGGGGGGSAYVAGTTYAAGGGAGGDGGYGIYFTPGGILTNSAIISGGDGGDGGGSPSYGGYAGSGGTGVAVSGSQIGSLTITNGGSILGGDGGEGGGISRANRPGEGPMVVGVAGAGGAGITGYGYDLTNTGSVIGGIGGQGGSMFIGPKSNEPGAGGAGAQGGVGAGGSNFTIHNTSVIGGGAGGAGGAGSDSQFAPVVPVGVTLSQHFTVPGSYATLAGKGEPGDDGGNGGAGGLGGLGGAGISGTSFTVINETTLYGGSGGLGGDGGRGGAGGTGGPGISLESTISVPGVVLSSTAGTGGAGGAGGNGGEGGTGGAGGVGVTGALFDLTNRGTLTGGAGAKGGSGGAAGVGGQGGVGGNVRVDVGPAVGDAAGRGVSGKGGDGNVGGAGGAGGTGGAGGAGVSGSSFTVTNAGSIAGGAGAEGGTGGEGGAGGSGGSAGSFQPGGSGDFQNSVNVSGAAQGGGNGGRGGDGGAGGAGVTGTDFSITSSGTISGGKGGDGGAGGNGGSGAIPAKGGTGGNGGNGGNGGVGVSGSSFTLTNTGTISGGDGGMAGMGGLGGARVEGGNGLFARAGDPGVDGVGGLGAVGVVSTGGSTIKNAGSIVGGLSGDGVTRANAVELSGGGNALELQAGYSFTGNVLSTSGATNGGDALKLGGTGAAAFDVGHVVPTLSGSLSGTQYVGFNALSVVDGEWTGTGTNASGLSWTLTGGVLAIADAKTLEGAGPSFLTTTFDGGTLRTTASLTLSGDLVLLANGGTLETASGTTATVDGALSGSGAFTKAGDGTATLTNANIGFTGKTVIDAGTLALSGAGSIANSTAVAVNATFDISGIDGAGTTIKTLSGSTDGVIALGTKALTVNQGADATFAGVISGDGTLTKEGASALTLTGANTYAGGTTISAGTLALSGAGSIANSSAVAVNATLDISGIDGAGTTIKTLSGSTDGVIALGTKALTVNQGADATFAGDISGSGAFTKEGASILTLTGANAGFTGQTVIDAGTLALAGAGSIANSTAVAVNATLDISGIDGAGTTINTLSGSTDGVIALGTKALTVNQGADATFAGALSGSGGFIKEGASTLTLTNANAGFTGKTVIDAGTLALSGVGSITNSNSVAVNAAFDISGLDGAGTTIKTLSGSGDGAIALGTKALTVNQGADATFAGALSGSGAFTKEGASALTLTGANTGFTGQTVIDAGTLALAGAGSIASSSAVAVNATFDISGLDGAGTTIKTLSGSGDGAIALGTKVLTVNQGADATFAGALSGSGAFTKEGASTLTLTNAHAGFTGKTEIDAGTLALAGAGSIASSSAVAVNAAFDISGLDGAGTTIKTLSGSNEGGIALGTKALTVNQGADATFAGVISGDGALTKEGASTLILTGANIYAGGTTISAGTLQIGDGGTAGSLTGDVLNNATLVFDRSDAYGFSGGLSGAGTMTFRGGGTVQLGSSGTFSGGTFVEDGTVTLANAALGASVFTVQTGGVLAGQGTIGGLVVNSGGIAAPGNSPGTLTVNGDVAFNSGSVYRVDVTAGGAHDLIEATGAVTLSSGASVAVNAGAAVFLPGTAYAIITTSGTVTGTFGSLTGDLPSSTYIFLDPGLSYDTHNVYLGLIYNDVAFTTFARTPNEAGAANAAQPLGDGNPIYDAILALPKGTTPGAAFAALSGEAYASASTVIVQQSSYVRDAVGARLIQALTPEGAAPLGYAMPVKAPATARLGAGLTPTLWALGYGGWGDTNGNSNAASVSNTIGGFLIGADVAVSETARAGLFGGYGRSNFDVADRASSGSIDTYDMGLYGAAQFGRLAARGALTYGWHEVSMDRTVAFPGFYEAISGGYSSGSFQSFGELAYGLTFGAFDVEPFAGLAYLNLDGASLTETGGAAALGVSTASFETTYSTLGMRLATSIGVFGRPLTPSVTLAWQHAFGDTTPYASMLFAGGTTPFQVAGAPIAQDALLVGAGLGYAASELATLSVKYNGQIASGASQSAFSAEFAWKF